MAERLFVGEALEWVRGDYNDKVTMRMERKYEGLKPMDSISYQRLMQDLSQVINSLGYTGRAYFGPTNSKTDIDLIA